MNRLILPVLFISLCYFCFAQKEKPISAYLPTQNVEKKAGNKRSNRPKRSHYDFIYVPNANKILYGNSCVLEETHRMGFEYLVEPRGISGSKTQKGKFFNNLWVKTKLVVRRSPFWKLILNKKIKKCKNKSGDLVG